ncbi:MAG: ATP-sensitive inward rectifier potassium channel 10 [Alkalinema sp. RU_4_3]|nr:ATP-sensitive inward rectifier potassium channel 10 [Alkalinema sp. RU_4_3]
MAHPVQRRQKVRKVSRRKVWITRRNGVFEIQGLDKWYAYWRDPYHMALTIPWTGFAAMVSIGYVLINAIFGLLYLLDPQGLKDARPGSFEDAFFFSVHTLASIGYGVISPRSTYANILVTIEAIISLLLIAVVTGLAFARFSKPNARIVFSRHAVVAPHNGIPTLIFRAANQRRNYIIEAHARVYLSRDEVTQEGSPMRRVYDLKLIRDVNPAFTLSWNLMHPIDIDSPFYGLTPEQWFDSEPQIIINLTGIDQTVSDSIMTRHTYTKQDLLWDHVLEDLIHVMPNGDRYVDYSTFDGVKPLKADR